MDASSPSPCFDYSQAVRYLFDRINYEKVGQRTYSQKNFRLARMHKLLEGLGNPHRKYPIIHIAGTKGKGSVAWLIAETFHHSGRTVGLYTSPHLSKLEERFCINGIPCSEQDLVNCVNKIHSVAELLAKNGDGQCTFFELTTAIGFLLFADRDVDLAVVEVGLGGRLDSTNVCSPIVSVITSISFDHQQQLGNTIPAIAGEKAGIIKPKVPVVSGVLNPEAIPVIAKKASESGSQLTQANSDFIGTPPIPSAKSQLNPSSSHTKCQLFNFEVLSDKISCLKPRRNVRLRMLGKHQIQNASTALAAIDVFCNELNWDLNEDAIESAFLETQVPARFQQFPGSPSIILDSAHNVASIDALLSTLDEYYPRNAPFRHDRVVVFAASSDKDYDKLLMQLIPATDTLIITQYFNNPRAVDSQTLYNLACDLGTELVKGSVNSRKSVEDIARPFAELHRAKSPSEAIQLARRLCKANGVICVTGSFFLASEVLPFLTKQ